MYSSPVKLGVNHNVYSVVNILTFEIVSLTFILMTMLHFSKLMHPMMQVRSDGRQLKQCVLHFDREAVMQSAMQPIIRGISMQN